MASLMPVPGSQEPAVTTMANSKQSTLDILDPLTTLLPGPARRTTTGTIAADV